MIVPEDLDAPQLERSFAHEWETALRFHGSHPPAAAAVVAQLRRSLAKQFAAVDDIVPRHQNRRQRVSNAFMRLNYEQRWRLRALSPLARRLLA
jgi:hypothetical protein